MSYLFCIVEEIKEIRRLVNNGTQAGIKPRF